MQFRRLSGRGGRGGPSSCGRELTRAVVAVDTYVSEYCGDFGFRNCVLGTRSNVGASDFRRSSYHALTFLKWRVARSALLSFENVLFFGACGGLKGAHAHAVCLCRSELASAVPDPPPPQTRTWSCCATPGRRSRRAWAASTSSTRRRGSSSPRARRPASTAGSSSSPAARARSSTASSPPSGRARRGSSTKTSVRAGRIPRAIRPPLLRPPGPPSLPAPRARVRQRD